MKNNFTYQTDFFYPVLAGSVLGHMLLVGITSLAVAPVKYSVLKAEQSVEFVLVKESPKESEDVIIKNPLPELAKAPEIQEETPEENEIVHEQISQPIQGQIQEAAALRVSNPAPPYPFIARKNGWEGVTVVKAYVEKDGLPSKVIIQASSGFEILDQSAMNTISKWNFEAAHSGSLKFSSWVTIPVRYQLINQQN